MRSHCGCQGVQPRADLPKASIASNWSFPALSLCEAHLSCFLAIFIPDPDGMMQSNKSQIFASTSSSSISRSAAADDVGLENPHFLLLGVLPADISRLLSTTINTSSRPDPLLGLDPVQSTTSRLVSTRTAVSTCSKFSSSERTGFILVNPHLGFISTRSYLKLLHSSGFRVKALARRDA